MDIHYYLGQLRVFHQNHKLNKTVNLPSKKKEESKIALKKNIKKDSKETKKKEKLINELMI